MSESTAAQAAPKRLGRPVGTGKGRTAKLNLTLTAAGKLAVQQAAERAGQSVGEWAEACAARELRKRATG